MSFLPFRALAVVGLSLMISACGGALSAAQGPGEVGKKAPSLSIQSLNGKGAVSLDEMTGKVTVVSFWATWCEPCKQTLAQLEELRAKSGGTVEVIGIAVDDTSRGVAELAKAQGVTFPIAWDENHSLMWRWSVEAMPTTYVLDTKGRIRFVHEPEKNKNQGELIAQEIVQLGGEAAPSETRTEVASAPPPAAQRVALAVAVSEPPPAATPPAAAEETTPAPPAEAASAAKPKTKPGAGKKGGAKKAPKKPAAKS